MSAGIHVGKCVNVAGVSLYGSIFLLLCFPLVRSVVYTDGKWMVEWRSGKQAVSRQGGVTCFLYDVRTTYPGSWSPAASTEVRTTNSSTLSVLVDECIRKQRRDLLRHHKGRVKRSLFTFLTIYPGTKWCGPGNVARDEYDLGPARKADACCRDHDTKCPIYILAGESKYGVKNNEIYTISDCRCDARFYDCLARAGTITANSVGDMFFNFIRVKCLQVQNADAGTAPSNIQGTIQHSRPYRSSTLDKVLGSLGGLLDQK
ncbi:hypothetical protein BsWGS_08422 [Bradybaena similaris]